MYKCTRTQQRDRVKKDFRDHLSNNKIITLKFSRIMLKKYGYSFSATARMASEVRKEIEVK